MTEVPRRKSSKTPPGGCGGASGTLVFWSQCDRLDNRRVSTIVRKLEAELGRRFRHFIWKGLRITINGDTSTPFDPLYLHPKARDLGRAALRRGDALRGPRRSDRPDEDGWVRVRFTELPVHAWHKLSNDEKRRIGISKGAGVSIVRGGREVDYGWFFMGSKHRENYDDWWRCEIQFDPILDEAFGITHTKQQARPQASPLGDAHAGPGGDGAGPERSRAQGAPRREGERALLRSGAHRERARPPSPPAAAQRRSQRRR